MSQTSDEECTVDPSLNPTIEALASCRRRCVLYYFIEHDDPTASTDDVCDYVHSVNPTTTDRSSVMVDLHHRLLPKLDELGLIDFDERSDTIRIRDMGRCGPVIRTIKEVES